MIHRESGAVDFPEEASFRVRHEIEAPDDPFDDALDRSDLLWSAVARARRLAHDAEPLPRPARDASHDRCMRRSVELS
jgi:hypothetical protein